MKKTFFKSLIIMIIILFSGCYFYYNPETFIDLSVKQNIFYMKYNDTISVSFRMKPNTVQHSSIDDFFVLDENKKQIFYKSYNTTETIQDSFQYIFSDENLTETQLFLRAKDTKSGLYSTKIITIRKTVVINSISANYSLQSPDNNMMFVIRNDTVLTADTSSINADLAFIFQASFGYCISSPDASWIHNIFYYNNLIYNLNNKKNTKIQKFNGKWNNITGDLLAKTKIISDTLALGGLGVQNIQVADVLLFETETGFKGALWVKKINKTTKNITVDFKYILPQNEIMYP